MKYPEGITAIERAALQKVFLLPAIPSHNLGRGRVGKSTLCHALPSLGSFYITTLFELQLFLKGIILKKPNTCI